MKRKLVISTLLALVLMVGLTVAAMAAGPGSNARSMNSPTVGYAGQGIAIHGTFVDQNVDGTCDNYAVRTPAQDGTGMQWGAGNQAGSGAGYGVGTQPQDGTGLQVRRGGRWFR